MPETNVSMFVHTKKTPFILTAITLCPAAWDTTILILKGIIISAAITVFNSIFNNGISLYDLP